MKTKNKFWMFLLVMLAGSMCNVVHAQQKYLCSIAMDAEKTIIQTVTFDNVKETLVKNGYTPLDMDMNRGAGGYFVGVGYKYTTDVTKSIKDFKIFIGYDEFYPYEGDFNYRNPIEHVFNGRKYKGPYCININDFGADLNQSAGGPCMYLYYTTEDDPNYPVEGVTEITAVCPETELTSMGEWEEVGGWDGTNVYNLVDANLGTTKHNNYVYLGFKTLKSGFFLDGNAQTSWENLNANINNSSNATVNLSAGKTTTKGIINATLVNTWNYNNETTKILALTGTSSSQPIIGTLSTPLINVQKGTVKMAGMEIINYGQGATMHQEGGKLILNSGSISTVTTRALVVDGGEIALGATEIGYYDDLPCEGFIALTVNQGATMTYDPANGKPRFYGITTNAATLGSIMPEGYTLADYKTGKVLTREEMLSQSVTYRWLTLAKCTHEMPLNAFADGDYKCCRCGTTMHFHINHTPATAEGTTCATCNETIIGKMTVASGTYYYIKADSLLDAVERNVRTSSANFETAVTMYNNWTLSDGVSLNYATPSKSSISFITLNDAELQITGNVSAPLISVNNAKATLGHISISNTNSSGAAFQIGSTGELEYSHGILSCTNDNAALRIDDGGKAQLSECELTSANIGSLTMHDIMPLGVYHTDGQAVYTKNQGKLVNLDPQYSGHLPYHLYIQECCDHEFVRQSYDGQTGAIRCKWCGYIDNFTGYFAYLTYTTSDGVLTTERINGFNSEEFAKVNGSSTPAILEMLTNMSIDGKVGEIKAGHELTITHTETVGDGDLTLNVSTSGYTTDWDSNPVAVNSGATLNIKGVNIRNDYHWAVYNEGTLNLYSGTLTGSQAVYNDGGTFNMYGGTLVGRQDTDETDDFDYGTVGFGTSGGAFNMYAGTIRTESERTDENRQRSFQYVNANTTVHLYGGTLENGFYNRGTSATLATFLDEKASAKVDGEACADPSSVANTDKSVVIAYVIPLDVVPAPSLTTSVETTSFYNTTIVTITNPTAANGSTTYYTINDGEPQVYTEPFEVSATTIIKAWAEILGFKSSETSMTVTKLKAPETIDEWKQIYTGITTTGKLADAVVTGINGKYIYVEDTTGGAIFCINNDAVYPSSITALGVGDKITGTFTAATKLSPDNDCTFLFTVCDFSQAIITTYDESPETPSDEAVTPEVVTLAKLLSNFAAYESKYIKLNDVELTDGTGSSDPTGTIKDGENTITIRSGKQGLTTPVVGATVNVTGYASYGANSSEMEIIFLTNKSIEATSFKITATVTDKCYEAIDEQRKIYYATYSTPYAFDVTSADKITVYEVKLDDDGKQLIMISYDKNGDNTIVPANTGVILETTQPGTFTFNAVLGEKAESATHPECVTNLLRPTGEGGITASEMANKDANSIFYRLTMHNGTKIGFYWGAADGAAFELGANKAYLAVPEESAKELKNQRIWSDSSETTAIKEIENNPEDGVIYDLTGRRVNKAQKGFYIVNGKKVVM